MNHITRATYDPQDNKIRLYPAEERLPPEIYGAVKAAGYCWAPQQKIFIAPAWTPERRDVAEWLAGEIEDEDTTAEERAEIRAERFAGHSEKRAEDFDRLAAQAQDIPDTVTARTRGAAEKAAAKAENLLKAAARMWSTSEYWTRRAAGAIRAQKYKEKPGVRARRIKGLEADRRKHGRDKAAAEKVLKLWETTLNRKDTGAPLGAREHALAVCNYFDRTSHSFFLSEYPREAPVSQYEGPQSLWSAIHDGVCTVQQAQSISEKNQRRIIANADEWLAHLDNRLAYEKALLEADGASALIEPKARPKQPPLLNYRSPEGITTAPHWRGDRPELMPQREMTTAEYKALHSDDKGTRLDMHGNRVRIAQGGSYFVNGEPNRSRWRACIFLTDSKEHPAPKAETALDADTAADLETIDRATKEKLAAIDRANQEKAAKTPQETQTEPATPEPADEHDEAPQPPTRAEQAQAIKDRLKGGIQAASAPQLFPTPRHVAERMAKLLEVRPGHRVLEPSAGTGVLLGALGAPFWGNTPETQARPVAIEINNGLCDNLRREFPLTDVICSDFLEFKPEFMRFDKIVANPPFQNGADIKHINHALAMLKPGGRLVAICAGGPRQEAQLKPLCSLWEPLPAGTFKDAGTMVNSVLLVIDKPEDRTEEKQQRHADAAQAGPAAFVAKVKPTQPKLF